MPLPTCPVARRFCIPPTHHLLHRFYHEVVASSPVTMGLLFARYGGICWVLRLLWLTTLLSAQTGLAFVARRGRGRVTMPLKKSNAAAQHGLRSADEEGSPDNRDNSGNTVGQEDRRAFLLELMSGPVLMAGASLGLVAPPVQDANARGLMQFPCTQPLVNNYHFMRAGTSLVEEEDGIWSTNPLFITNREYALSEAGRKMAIEQAQVLKQAKNLPTLAYHSLAAHGIDTADIIGQELQMGRERVLPEFTYLDQRGIGGWNDGAIDEVLPAIYALDAYEASKEGVGGRPPPNTDGTPNEALADQFVRLRQFLSLLESRTSGENVLLIFPDGTGPALLSCMVAGIPYNCVHALEFKPGELRQDITRESVLELYQQKKNDPEYLATLERGKEKLIALKEQGKDVMSLKDQRAEENRLAMEKIYRDKEDIRLKREAAEYQRAREKRLNARRDKSEETKNDDNDNSNNMSPVDSTDDNMRVPSSLLAAGGGIGLAGLVVTFGVGSADDKLGEKSALIQARKTKDTGVAAQEISSEENDYNNTSIPTTNSTMNDTIRNQEGAQDKLDSVAPNIHGYQSPVPDNAANKDEAIDKELQGLEAASKAMDGFLEKKKETTVNAGTETTEDKASLVDGELDKLESAQKAMDEYLDADDGYYDWLKVVADIANEPDYDGDDEFLQVEADPQGVNGNATIQY